MKTVLHQVNIGGNKQLFTVTLNDMRIGQRFCFTEYYMYTKLLQN